MPKTLTINVYQINWDLLADLSEELQAMMNENVTAVSEDHRKKLLETFAKGLGVNTQQPSTIEELGKQIKNK